MGNARGWLAYLVDLDDDDEDAELIFFCPACAAREFRRCCDNALGAEQRSGHGTNRRRSGPRCLAATRRHRLSGRVPEPPR
jgi:hypothetical protein